MAVGHVAERRDAEHRLASRDAAAATPQTQDAESKPESIPHLLSVPRCAQPKDRIPLTASLGAQGQGAGRASSQVKQELHRTSCWVLPHQEMLTQAHGLCQLPLCHCASRGARPIPSTSFPCIPVRTETNQDPSLLPALCCCCHGVPGSPDPTSLLLRD